MVASCPPPLAPMQALAEIQLSRSPLQYCKLQLRLVPPLAFLQDFLLLELQSASGLPHLLYFRRQGPAFAKCVELEHSHCNDPQPLQPTQAFPWTPSPVSYQPPQNIFKATNPGHVSHFLSGKCSLAIMSLVNSLHFVVQTPVAVFPFEILKLLTVTTGEGVSKCEEMFPPSGLPAQGAGPYSKILCLFFFFNLFILLCLILRPLVCLFRSLGSSARIQNSFCKCCSTCRWTFLCICGVKVISPSYSSAILNVLSNSFFVESHDRF